MKMEKRGGEGGEGERENTHTAIPSPNAVPVPVDAIVLIYLRQRRHGDARADAFPRTRMSDNRGVCVAVYSMHEARGTRHEVHADHHGT